MSVPYAPISDIVPWTQYIAGLNQTIYSTTWTANDASDILVYSRDPNVPASDVLQLIPSSQYTVQFIGSDNIVQVTFGMSYIQPQYNIVTIMRNTPSEFLNLYTNTNFTPSMLNGDFETLTQIDQQNQLYWQQIVPRYNNSATVNVPIDTILPVLSAGEFWIKNSTNTAFIPATLGDSGEFPVLGPFVLFAANSNYPEGFNLGSLASGVLAQIVAFNISTPYSIPLPFSVSVGGTGLSSITPNAVLIGGSTSTSPILPIASLGGIGDVLTSSGPSAAPSWQPAQGNDGSLINIQVFTSGGTYTPTAGASTAIVEIVGGGGGSGGCALTSGSQAASSAGGGGGGYSRKFLASLSSQTVTIGSGGLAGTSGNNAGGTGGTTSFGAICSALGGVGSSGSAASVGLQTHAGGAGGSASGGDVNINGSDGGNSQLGANTGGLLFNNGGSSFFAGSQSTSLSNGTALAGQLYGGGAAGATNTISSAACAGAAGAPGICIITEYI